MTNNTPFDFSAKIITEKGEGILLDDGHQKFWLPKSETKNNNNGTFTIPQWLALDKGIMQRKTVASAIKDLFEE